MRARLFARNEETAAPALPGPSRLRRERRNLLRAARGAAARPRRADARDGPARPVPPGPGARALRRADASSMRASPSSTGCWPSRSRCGGRRWSAARAAPRSSPARASARAAASRSPGRTHERPGRRMPAVPDALRAGPGVLPRVRAAARRRGTGGDHQVGPPSPPARRNRTWIWAALGGLVVAAAGAAVAIAVSGNGNGATLTMTTTLAPIVTATAAATDPGAQPPQPAATVVVTTVATVPTAPADTATATTATKPTLIVWPGKTAYTVVLDSLPSPGGHTDGARAGEQGAREGAAAGRRARLRRLPEPEPRLLRRLQRRLRDAPARPRQAPATRASQGFGSAYPRQIAR